MQDTRHPAPAPAPLLDRARDAEPPPPPSDPPPHLPVLLLLPASPLPPPFGELEPEAGVASPISLRSLDTAGSPAGSSARSRRADAKSPAYTKAAALRKSALRRDSGAMAVRVRAAVQSLMTAVQSESLSEAAARLVRMVALAALSLGGEAASAAV
eukprot:scaffold20725_cov111-Isochrysis_galbana.AAC.2